MGLGGAGSFLIHQCTWIIGEEYFHRLPPQFRVSMSTYNAFDLFKKKFIYPYLANINVGSSIDDASSRILFYESMSYAN